MRRASHPVWRTAASGQNGKQTSSISSKNIEKYIQVNLQDTEISVDDSSRMRRNLPMGGLDDAILLRAKRTTHWRCALRVCAAVTLLTEWPQSINWTLESTIR
ncbi:hypothetical protein RRG08_044240 [Elysia crispata]|uniref:Uncharacterized protein n=1 Tax=Elysia crispata TaxID=231223 RepID=A0AAE0XX96_9GAST|nr:hypothetical protein RRG08_044240 [Elysia crispata]